MTRLLFSRSTRLALTVLSLSLVTAAVAQLRTEHPDTDPDVLACAAGVHCRADWERDGLTPTEVQVILGLNDEEQARQRLDEVRKQWPQEVWDCAASGPCPDGMTRDQAREKIPMDPEGIEQLAGDPAPKPKPKPKPTPTKKKPGIEVDRPGPTESRQDPDGISVEVPRPGPSEIDLQPSRDGDIQPLDGHWVYTEGEKQFGGQCMPMLVSVLSSEMPSMESGPVSFPKPFHPAKLMPGKEVSWTRTGANQWEGRLNTPDGPLSGQWTYHIVDPERIDGSIYIVATIPARCTITIPFVVRRQGAGPAGG